MVFRKNVGTRSQALKVERRVKRLSKVNKEKLIKDPDYADQIVNWAKS